MPITEYCDKNKLTPRERLKLFIPVCQAIQHAHQKGIIHRDIKPTNVLLTLYDGKPVPKVIDFGIAKATQQKLTERTMFTGIGQILGTLEYMSPEQAEMNQLDIDTRSDVYSLGVMLYELLTGSTPISKEKLRNVGFEEMLRAIRETEPPKPSTRLSNSGEALPTISDVRKTDPGKLSKFVRGDLDWIVMKALEKDRTRRYETANGLAADVQRFLDDEAVTACPPSAGYMFRKFARRNKTTLITGATIATILIVATITSTWLAFWAMRAEKAAAASAVEATAAAAGERLARERAEANEAAATREATKSKEVATFLSSMLKGVGPSVALGRDTKMLEEILENTVQRIGEDLKDQPEVAAELRTVIATVYRELGLYEDSEAMFRAVIDIYQRHLPGDSDELASALSEYGVLLAEDLARNEPAVEMAEAAVEMTERLYGNDHPRYADCLTNVSQVVLEQGRLSEAEAKARTALNIRLRRLGDRSAKTATSLHELGVILRHQANYIEAEKLLKQALEIRKERFGEIHPDYCNTLHSLAVLYSDQIRRDEAREIYKSLTPIYIKLYGESHAELAANYCSLAHSLSRAEDADAVKYFREALRIRQAVHGLEHPQTALSLRLLGERLGLQGKSDEALQLLMQSLDVYRACLGSQHVATAQALGFVATELLRQSRFEEAKRYRQEAIAILRSELGDRHHHLGVALNNLGHVLQRLRDLQGAETAFREAVEIFEHNHGSSILVASVKHQIGYLLWKQDRPVEAEKWKREALALRAELHGANHPRVALTLFNLAYSLRDQGKLAESADSFRRAREIYEANEDERTGQADKELVSTLIALITQSGGANNEEGIRALRELSELQLLNYPETYGYIASRYALGQALIAEKEYSEAETEFRQLLEDMEGKPKNEWRRALVRVGLKRAMKSQGEIEQSRQYQEAEEMLRRMKVTFRDADRSAEAGLGFLQKTGLSDRGWCSSVEVSPDGKHVYSAAYGDGTMTGFARDMRTGSLQQIQTIDGVVKKASGFQFNSDGSLCGTYCGRPESGVALFKRDSETGTLTTSCVFHGDDGNSFENPRRIAFSQDSKLIFVLDKGSFAQNQDAIVTLRITDDLKLEWIATTPGPAGCFDKAKCFGVHPNGKWLYVLSPKSNAVTYCEIDSATGKLTIEQVVRHEDNGIRGLKGAYRCVCSRDGQFLYVTSRQESASSIEVFRIGEDGRLSQVQHLSSTDDPIGPIEMINGITVSNDGPDVFVSGSRSGTVTRFRSNSSTGLLSHAGTLFLGMPLHSEGGPASVCVSPDGTHVYVPFPEDDSIAVIDVIQD